ncbi:hypothetical protein CCR75_003252 [Bremia lactucae]|uniref:RRM domain-containing protein n=1 Tax=Bremia lactucae TaxID=4779 RepID=A0A976FKM3_BRELC|nr:hypothetical protein CCR75_003252 [Bremia lactucae]
MAPPDGWTPKTPVIVASNRLPVRLNKTNDGHWSVKWAGDRMIDSQNGLSHYEVSQRASIKFVGSVADVDIPLKDQDEIEALLREFNCFPVFLELQEAKLYYEKFCKQTLWPAFHNVVDVYSPVDVVLDVEAQQNVTPTAHYWNPDRQKVAWQAYVNVNQLYAHKICELYDQGDVVWIQDYHLLLTPSYIVRKLRAANVGLFLHVPFPSSEVFRTLSMRKELLRGMLNADHIGFHLFEYARHFMSACRRILGLRYRPVLRGQLGIDYGGRRVAVTCSHMAIDVSNIENTLNTKDVRDLIVILRQKYRDKKIFAGCDTIERLKGIPSKMLAFDGFLSRCPDFIEKAVLVQKGIHRRGRVTDYLQSKKEIGLVVQAINQKYYDSVHIFGNSRPFLSSSSHGHSADPRHASLDKVIRKSASRRVLHRQLAPVIEDQIVSPEVGRNGVRQPLPRHHKLMWISRLQQLGAGAILIGILRWRSGIKNPREKRVLMYLVASLGVFYAILRARIKSHNMGRRDEEMESGRRHGRRRASPSPIPEEENEEAIRNKLRESGWKKYRADSMEHAEASTEYEKAAKDRVGMGSPRPLDDRRGTKSSRSSRHSRSPRRREHRSSRRKSSGHRRRSPSGSPASRPHSRSRSASRRHRRHSSLSRKRHSSRSPSRVLVSKRSRRVSSQSRSTSASMKPKTRSDREKKERKQSDEMETMKQDVVELEKNDERASGFEPDKEVKDDVRHRSRKSSRRSRSGSLPSPSRSLRRRRHRRSSYSRSHSLSRPRRPRRGGSRSRSRSVPRDRRPRGRERRTRRRGRSYSRSPSYSRRRNRTDRSSSRDRPRRDTKDVAEPLQPAPDAAPPATMETAPAAPTTSVNPTITQLMAQYPTMSLQDIIAKMQASNVTMAAAVAQKPARELYVGNLPPSVTGPQLQEFLSTIVQQVGLTTQPGNPIINTWISTDGHFAFCEMRSVEECNLALLLNQLSLLGQPLKFGRPRSFMGPPQPMPQISARTQTALINLGCSPNPAWFAQPTLPGMETNMAESTLAEATLSAIAAAQPTNLSSGVANLEHHRLLMSNIPVVLTEAQIKELVEPFGKLQLFTLVKDPVTGASLGNALFEYEDNSVAAQAVEGLNGLSIGGILLSVQRQPSTNGVRTIQADQLSAVLKMENMVMIEELNDDDEYADLAEDVEEECKRFGNVIGMEIPRPKDGEEVAGLGCIYVRFEKQEEAVSALKALNGRKFGGNIVNVSYYPQEKFEIHELS